MGLILIVVLFVVGFALIAQARDGRGIFTTATTHTDNATDPAVIDTPLEILRKRYARGEIDRAEFEERQRELVS